MSSQASRSNISQKNRAAQVLRPLGLLVVLAAGFGLAGLATSRDGDGGPLTSRFTVAELSSLEVPINSLDMSAAMTNPAAAATKTVQLSVPAVLDDLDLEALPRPVAKPQAAIRMRMAAGKPVFVGPKRLPIPVKKPSWIGRNG